MAKSVLKNGNPELIEDLRQGKITVKTAHKQLNLHTQEPVQEAV